MRTTQNYYKEQTFSIRMENEFIIRTKVEGVDRLRMFCSPSLFTFIHEAILRDLEITSGLIFGGQNLNTIGYADVTVLIAVKIFSYI